MKEFSECKGKGIRGRDGIGMRYLRVVPWDL